MKQHYCQILLIFVLFSLLGEPLSAQCPDFTNATLGGADCTNGTTACDVCAGDVITLEVEGTDLPDGGTVDWYYSNTPSFNPYNGQGTFMGSADITTTSTNPPCTDCPQLLGIMIDACPDSNCSSPDCSEDNEFMVLWSGSGFDVNALTVDVASQNNIGGINDDINLGGNCTWGIPDPGLISGAGCNNVVAAGPGTSIPPNAPVIIFPSAGATATFDFSSLCITGVTIYIMQGSCDRTAGAFSNGSSSGLRTTTIGLTNCPCSDAITYDTDDPEIDGGSNGDFVVEIPPAPPIFPDPQLFYGNGGCNFPMGVMFPPDSGGSTTEVDPLDFTATADMCNDGPYYAIGIINPAPTAPCPQELTTSLEFNVICPVANPITTEVCLNNNGTTFIDLTQFESAIHGGTNLPVNWFNDMNGLDPVSPPLNNAVVDPNDPNFYVTIGTGDCVSPLEVFTVNFTAGPDLSGFSFVLDPTSSCGASNVSAIFSFPGGGTYDVVLDVGGASWTGNVISGAPYLLGNFNQTTDVTLISVDAGNCPTAFSPAPVETFTIETPPNAAPFSMEMCEDANGEATFDLTSIESIVNLGENEDVNWFEDMGFTPIDFPDNYTINNSTTIFANVGTEPCVSQFVNINLTVNPAPDALPETLDACDDGGGFADFDLTSLDNDVNNGSGNTVTWYETEDLLDQINSPDNYNSSGGSVFAIVSDGQCASDFVEITLTVTAGGTPTLGTVTLCETDMPYDLTQLEDPAFPIGMWDGDGVNGDFFDPSGQSPSVDLTFMPTGDCAQDGTTTLIINEAETPVLGTATICDADGTYDLSNLVDPAYPTGIWSGDGVQNDGMTFDPTGQGTSATVTFQSDADCTNSETTTITIESATPVVLMMGETCEDDGLFDLNTLLPAGSTTGEWTGTGVEADGFSFNPMGLLGSNTVTFTPDEGCNSGEMTTVFVAADAMTNIMEIFCSGSGNSVTVGPDVYDEAMPTGTTVLTTEFGCDSTINVVLIFDNPMDGTYENTLCPGGSEVIGGIEFNEMMPTGPAILPSFNGCDSTVMVTLTFENEVTENIDETFCSGSGAQVMVGMDVYDETTPMGTTMLQTPSGCDSTVIVNLTFENPMDGTYENTLCPGQSETIGGIEFNEMMPTGPAVLQTPNGCDSTVMVTLTFEDEITVNIDETFCAGSGEEVMVGMDIYNEMMPMGTTTLQTAGGCDSVVIVNLIFDNPMDGTYENTLCAGQSETIGGIVFDEMMPSGPAILPSFNGCDSTVMVTLTFEDEIIENINETFCAGSGAEVQVGMDIYNEMMPTGTTTLQTPSGCDSIINVVLTFETPMDGTYENTLCPGQSETIGGIVFDEMMPSGPAILQTPNGCDSTVMVTLTFANEVTENINETFCSGSGEEVVVGMDIYNEMMPMGTTMLQTAGGCDSIVNVNLTFETPMNGTYENTLCPGQSETIGGIEFNEMMPSGPAILQTPNGCDSTVMVTLIFENEITVNIEETFCSGSGAEVIVGMDVYNEMMPMGTTTLQTTGGCDSIVNVNLTYLNEVTENIVETFCTGSGAEVIVGMDVYNEMMPMGTTTLQTTGGCDSIVNVNLTYLNEVTENIVETFCTGSGAEVIVGMDVYNEMMPMGTTTLQTTGGCDSIVNVNLTYLNEVTENIIETFCTGSGAEVIVGMDVYNEMMPMGTTTLQTTGGCDSIVNVNLTYLNEVTENIVETFCTGSGAEVIVGMDVYNEMMPMGTTTLQTSGGCDSIVNVNLTYLNEVTENIVETFCTGSGAEVQVGTDIYNEMMPMGTTTLQTTGGCDSIVNVNLTFETPIPGTYENMLCTGDSETIGGTVFDENMPTGTAILQSANGCDSMVMVTITFVNEVVANITETLCPGESITIDGVTYDENLTMGSTTLPMGSFFGCDSTTNVSISFFPEAISDFSATFDIDETIDIGGVTFSASNPSGTVVLPMSSVNGCDSTINVNLQFTQEYIVEQFSVAPLCPGENTGMIVIDTIETIDFPLFVTLDGVPQGTFVSFPIEIPDLFAGFYTLQILNSVGQEVNTEIEVSPAPPLILDLGDNQTVRLGDAIELSGQTTLNDADWQWNPPLYLSCDTCLKTISIPLEQITYELTGTTPNGCTVSDNITLFIQRSTPVFAPNVFSPNNDGVNDFFYIHATSEVAKISNFQIFDRWGGMVFSRAQLLPNDPLMGWNGMYNDEIVEQGVYVFFVEVELVDGQKEMLKGGVTLIR